MPLVRIGLLTEGGYPYATGEARLWCDRLVRGLPQHEFELYALSRSAEQEERGRVVLPEHVTRVWTAPLWAPADDGRSYSRRERKRFADCFRDLVRGICAGDAAAFAAGLYGLAELARDQGGLYAALRSETAVRAVESACRAPGAQRSVQRVQVADLLEFVDALERLLRPLSLDWYEDLREVDVCHAAAGGVAALAGLLAKRFFGVPLLVTEYGVRLRAHYLERSADADAPPGPGPGGGPAGVAAMCIRDRPSTYGSPARSTPGPTSSPPATPTPGAGRSGAGPPGTGCGRCTPGWRRTDSPRSARTPTAAIRTPWCGWAGSSPPRT